MRIMLRRLAVFGALVGIVLAFATPANARVWVGIGVPFGFGYYGPPAYYPPPAYYYPPPPAYYPPPPAYYPPPQASYAPVPRPTGQSCMINGSALCPMERPTAAGSTCWCSTSNGRVYGQAS